MISEQSFSSQRNTRPSSQSTPCFGHVRPPAGVTIIGMTELHLSLDLSRLSIGSVKNFANRLKKRQKIEPPSEDRPVCLPTACSQVPVEHRRSNHSSPGGYLTGWQGPAEPQGSQPRLPSRMRNAKKRQVGRCIGAHGKRDEDSPDSRPITTQAVVELTDTAFRSLISSRPVKRPPAVKITRQDEQPSLAAIAPGVFSPGYLPVSLSFLCSLGVDPSRQY